MNLAILRNEKDIRDFATGVTIFEDGDPANVMYGVVEGTVNILVGDRVIETAEPGTLFGEMALIDEKPRSARAIAASPCRLACIDKRRFLFLVQQTPNFALQVMRTLADRLRRRTDALR
jgi:CRP/FNR family cyclic AMP-dependent transcriptional regulator